MSHAVYKETQSIFFKGVYFKRKINSQANQTKKPTNQQQKLKEDIQQTRERKKNKPLWFFIMTLVFHQLN